MLLLIAVVVSIVGARADLSQTRDAYFGTKGGHGSQGRGIYSSADTYRVFNGNTNYSSFGVGGFSHTSRNLEAEPGVGVCFVEVPTSSLVLNPSQVPAGNGSRPDLSRIRSCCSGYTRNIHNHLLCDPVCSKGCQNAICVAPETCSCFPDHVKNVAGFCVATCPIGCQNGHCAGSTCQCHGGFTLEDHGKFCVPKCDEHCGGSGIGNCTAPNTCTCKPGYTSTPSGSCRQSSNYNPLQNNIYNQNQGNFTNNPLYPNLNQYNISSNPNYPHQNGQNPNGQHYPNQNGQSHSGQYPNQNGQNPNGQNPNGQYPNQNGQYPNGQHYPIQNGQSPNGQNPNGQYYPNQNGRNPNGQYPYQNGPYPNGQYNPNQNNPYITTDIHQQRNFSSDSLTTSQVNVDLSNHSLSSSSYQGNQNYQPGQRYPEQYPHQNQYNPNINPNQYWQQIPTDQNVNEDLVPRCSQPCINGVCMPGNRCSCNPGYELDSNDPSGTRCRPRCSGGCQNGVCSAPNFCICDIGYRKEQGVKGGAARCIKRLRRSILDMIV